MHTSVIFYVLASALVACSLGVILSRSATYSVLSLVAAMGFLSGLFFLLGAYLVGMVLLLVYAGAVLVLFLFVVMTLDLKETPCSLRRGFGFLAQIVLSVAAGGALFWQCMRAIHALPAQPPQPVAGSVEAVGIVLFRQYVLPFELTSLLIFSGILSVIVLAKKDSTT